MTVHPQHIGRYEIQRTIGQGGMGTVYLARDPKLNREVAVKVLAPHVDDPELRRRFETEAQVIATLRHPNIIQIYDYSDVDSPSMYLVMEYVPGPTLFDLLHERGPFSEQTALCVAHELTSALAYAHSQNLVHRDLKPENVVLSDGRVVLLDFGAIKIVGANHALGVEKVSDTTLALGTPGFMAPEQFTGRAVDHRTDIFALGALLYNVTTDALPYHGDTDDVSGLYRAAKRGRYRDPRDRQPLLSSGFCALLEECLETRKARRLADVDEMRERTLRLLQAHGISDVKAELRRYEGSPDGDIERQEARTVEALTRDLQTALFRALQVALRQRKGAQVKRLVNQLQRIDPHVTPPSLQVSTQGRRLLGQEPRRVRRAWLLFGVLIGVALGGTVSWLSGLLATAP